MQTIRRPLLQPASAAAILGTDWLIDALSSFFELELLSRASVWGAIFGAIVVFLVENVARPSAPVAALAKGAVAGALIAAPGPMLGTSLALCALAWSALVYLAERAQRARR